VRRRIPAVVSMHSVVPQTHVLARAAHHALGTDRWPVRFSAVSERVANDVRAISGTQPMTVLPNGIDIDFWRCSDARAERGDTVRLISVMRLNAKKRPRTLIDLMRALDARLGPTHRVHLRVVGDGPERRRLERAIARHGLGDRIELLGHASRNAIRDLLASSDVFVLPAVRESFGLAALEARCAGLPVVAMAGSGVAELIRHGREGLLARSDLELASHVETLVRDPEMRHAMAAHNRAVRPPHDWAAVIAAHLALYREAIALRDSAWAERT
jgi:glycosyltransferase involved in cell wall biosynthesis